MPIDAVLSESATELDQLAFAEKNGTPQSQSGFHRTRVLLAARGLGLVIEEPPAAHVSVEHVW